MKKKDQLSQGVPVGADILLQIATDLANQERLRLTAERHASYCQKWGLQHITITDGGAAHAQANWEKLRIVRNLLAERNGCFVALIDADALVAREDVDLRTALPDWAWLGVSIHPFPWPPRGPRQRTFHYNCGALYFRCCPECLEFLDTWLAYREEAEKSGASEQCVLNEMLLSAGLQNGLVALDHRWNANVHNMPHKDAVVVAWHGADHRTARMRLYLDKTENLSDHGAKEMLELARVFHAQSEQCRKAGADKQHENYLRQAVKAYRVVLDRDPLDVAAMIGMIDAQAHLPEPNDNISLGLLACGLQPDNGEAHAMLACALADENDKRASHHFERALQLNPDWPDLRWDLALWQLKTGNWREGLRNYRARWQSKCKPRFYTPEWDGKRPAETLLVSTEQGFGDTLLYLRFLPALRTLLSAATVYVEVEESLVPLLADQPIFHGFHFVTQSKAKWLPLQGVQEWVSLFTLPEMLGLKSFADLSYHPKQYIDVPKKPRKEGKMRIGLRWRGNPKFAMNGRRSLPEEALAYFEGLDVEWYCFQDGQMNMRLPWKGFLKGGISWRATAEVLNEIDLLVTTATGILHLAGAMGKDTLLLLPTSEDWRWGMNNDARPWYPCVETISQTMRGDWESVMKRAVERIEEKRQCLLSE
ncbi:MAG TPA: hypothetical protein VJQ82_17210 [Terriglobales bacterium]|nr:hypothetical protein [Terriglobales bacterium]